jgi:hypothetical protein
MEESPTDAQRMDGQGPASRKASRRRSGAAHAHCSQQQYSRTMGLDSPGAHIGSTFATHILIFKLVGWQKYYRNAEYFVGDTHQNGCMVNERTLPRPTVRETELTMRRPGARIAPATNRGRSARYVAKTLARRTPAVT